MNHLSIPPEDERDAPAAVSQNDFAIGNKECIIYLLAPRHQFSTGSRIEVRGKPWTSAGALRSLAHETAAIVEATASTTTFAVSGRPA